MQSQSKQIDGELIKFLDTKADASTKSVLHNSESLLNQAKTLSTTALRSLNWVMFVLD